MRNKDMNSSSKPGLLAEILIFMFSILIFNSCQQTTKHQNTFNIYKTSEAVQIDGRITEVVWQKAERLNGFKVDANPNKVPKYQTEIRLAYSDDHLLVAFICQLEKGQKKQSGDDFCELSTFFRPEAPYYSPYLQRLDYLNAAEAVRTTRRFKIGADGTRSEANVYKEGPHTYYLIDESWDCPWESAVSRNKGQYIVEAKIPWKALGGLPKAGDTFLINFIREVKDPAGSKEISCFNWYASDNIRVKPFASENFIQEYTTIFASVEFSDNQAILKRFVELEDPWRVQRSNPEYEKVLSTEPEPLRSAHFYLGLNSFLLSDKIKKLYDPQTWNTEEENFYEELARAGLNGPSFLPGILKGKGLKRLQDLYNRYSMRFSYYESVSSGEAKKAGARILTPPGHVAFFDPVFIKLKRQKIKDFLGQYGSAPWLFDIRGQDEPFNEISTILQPGMYDQVNQELKKLYGQELRVPPGIPNVPYQNQPIHEDSRKLPDQATILSRLAMFRWINDLFIGVAKQEYELIHQLAPDKLYQAYNRNSVADLDFLDQAKLWDYTDYFSADPYPSFCFFVYGPARSRYHVGFTSKLVTDLAAGKPTQMIIQGCEMFQRLSTVENVREWASQAAKVGVTLLDWWGTPRLDYPDVYKEMVRLSRLWKKLPKISFPAKSDIAILFSDDARAAAGDEGLHSHYTLHVLIGEKLGAWFSFVSENHLRRGLHNLDDKKLILAPQLAYVSRTLANELIKRVEAGATMVVFDPEIFTYDFESGPLLDLREKLIGISLSKKVKSAYLYPTQEARNRFRITSPLPLRPIRLVSEPNNAWVLNPPADALILFTYQDGTPAGYSRRIGKGEVLYFGAMPFQDSELSDQPSGWEIFLSALIDEKGIERNLPIWRFQFPATGGEIEFFEPLTKIPFD